jgi:hypothetical protein
MASVRVVAAALLSGLCLSACNPPVPDYKINQYPAPYRKEPDGAVLDNEDMRLDAEGYRLDQQGRRIGEVNVQEKTAGESSNAVAGYYISSRGAMAPGNVMVPSEGAASGATGVNPVSTTGMPASGAPAPLTPPK